ncbi:ATP-binding protein [Cellulomonas endometrii]|uniref:ATP-binding protein n=1 Tax=Cellulomonas endometrii TaxID=3036301 RepID=UPI0024ADF00B|nr:ATP-binding protein [Cellulomonas endometrii]
MPPADGAVELRVDGAAEPGWLDEVHDALARLWAVAPAVPDVDRFRFETAVIEIATNIVRHTRPVGRGPVLARALLRAQPDRIEAELSDTGTAVDVDLDPEPVDDLAESGRGIALVLRAVDSLSLVREGDRNTWRLSRVWAR